MALLTVKEYENLTNKDKSSIYKLIKSKKLISHKYGSSMVIELSQDELDELYSAKKSINKSVTTDNPIQTVSSNNDAIVMSMLQMLKEKDSILSAKDDALAKKDEIIAEMMEENRRFANMIANRFEQEFPEAKNKNHLKFDKKID